MTVFSGSSWISLTVLIYIIPYIYCQQTNQYQTWIDTDGTYIWESITDFIPVQSQSFGSIPLGEIMQMEFDFTWWGRTNDPFIAKYEMFFRVGFDSSGGNNCDGQGARYPSFWLTGNADTLHVSVSNDNECQPSQSLNNYGIITIGRTYHISMFFNNTLLMVSVSGGNKPNFTQIWPRKPTQSKYFGVMVPIWWMSSKYGRNEYYNRGNGTFTNVILKSETPTISPTITPTNNPITYTPTITPTNNPTIIPSITPTNNPSIIPTIQPTNIPTNIPSNIPSNMPTIYPTSFPTSFPTSIPTTIPTNSPTKRYTLSPTTEPSLNPSSNPSLIPTYNPSSNPSLIPTYNPSLSPTNTITISPTMEPTIIPTYIPTINPSIVTTSRPTYGRLYTTTTLIPIDNTIININEIDNINDNASNDKNELGKNVKEIEIAIFSIVVALCFCTVFSFLAYLTFKRKVNNIKKKRKSYHLQNNDSNINFNNKQMEMELSNNNKKENNKNNKNSINYKVTINNSKDTLKIKHTRSKSLKSPSKTHTKSLRSKNNLSKSLRSPSKTTEHINFESVYLSLGQYKSDSLPNSHLSISAMNMNKDATPTPAVSPNDNIKEMKPGNKKQIIRNYSNDITETPREIGFDIYESDSEEEYKNNNKNNKKKKIIGNDMYEVINNINIKREKKKFEPREEDIYSAHEIEEPYPYEQYIDNGGYGLYTTPLNAYGKYRKNTENTEGYDSEKDSENTDFYNTYNNEPNECDDYKHIQSTNGYEFIKKTLLRVDAENMNLYLSNFKKHKVADNRLMDLLPEDWKELIPVIGPRNHFKRIYNQMYGHQKDNSNGFLGEFESYENEQETTINTILNSLSNVNINTNTNSCSNSNSNNNSEYSDDDDQLSNKEQHYEYEYINKSLENNLMNQIFDRNDSNNKSDEFDSESDNKSDAKTNSIDLNHSPQIDNNNNNLSVLRGRDPMISPPISPHQYNSHIYEHKNILMNKHVKYRKQSDDSTQSNNSNSSSIPPPIPNDCPENELKKPLPPDPTTSEEDDDELIGIPKFEVDVDTTDSDSSDTTSESDTQSTDTQTHTQTQSNDTQTQSDDTQSGSQSSSDNINDINDINHQIYEQEYEEEYDSDESVSVNMGDSSTSDDGINEYDKEYVD